MSSSFVIREPGFFCQKDENFFFDWLNTIPGVKEIRGVPTGLLIEISVVEIDRLGWSDLIGLFSRYQVDINSMRSIEFGTHAKWLKEPNHYWHASLFPD